MRERLTNLLRTLLDSSASSLSDLGKQFNVTTKTIRNEIQVLNEVLAEKSLPYSISKEVSPTIIFQRNSGIRCLTSLILTASVKAL